MAPVTIFHNPACSNSRNTLALIRASGVAPEIIEYLKTPPSKAQLMELLQAMGMRARELLRDKETLAKALGLADAHWSDEAIVEQMVQHPSLINRPIVVSPMGTRLCRPPELVLDILPTPPSTPASTGTGPAGYLATGVAGSLTGVATAATGAAPSTEGSPSFF